MAARKFNLENFLAPSDERAVLKRVPMAFRDHPVVMSMVRKSGGRVRYPTNRDNRYRAETFSVYL